MGKRSRDKGANWERELSGVLRRVWPGARRGIGQARSAKEVADVEGTPFWVEAKVGALTNPRAAIRQAEAATDGRPVVAICKDNASPGRRLEVWVTMRLETFLAQAAAADGVPLRGQGEVGPEPLVPGSSPSGDPGISKPLANAKTGAT